jgi:hypothetical protein
MNLTGTIYVFRFGLIFYDGTGVLKVLRKKSGFIKSSKSCILLDPMTSGTCAREKELQRVIITTPHKIGYLIIRIKNMSTF